jgi:hypothetical protein
MDRVQIGPAKGVRIAVTAFVVSIVVLLCVVGGTLFLLTDRSSETEAFSAELRAGLVTNCQRGGNPLRKAVQRMLREQIAQSKHIDLAKFFPQIPPAELQRLIAEQNAKRRALIRSIAPVDCTRLYPTP